MNKNEYKVNTYVLIKNGEIYEIDEEGCVKKAKNGENVPFYRKREISEALCKMTKRKSSKFLLVKKDDFIHMETLRNRKNFLFLNVSIGKKQTF